jgi:hypothetical protein
MIGFARFQLIIENANVFLTFPNWSGELHIFTESGISSSVPFVFEASMVNATSALLKATFSHSSPCQNQVICRTPGVTRIHYRATFDGFFTAIPESYSALTDVAFQPGNMFFLIAQQDGMMLLNGTLGDWRMNGSPSCSVASGLQQHCWSSSHICRRKRLCDG